MTIAKLRKLAAETCKAGNDVRHGALGGWSFEMGDHVVVAEGRGDLPHPDDAQGIPFVQSTVRMLHQPADWSVSIPKPLKGFVKGVKRTEVKRLRMRVEAGALVVEALAYGETANERCEIANGAVVIARARYDAASEGDTGTPIIVELDQLDASLCRELTRIESASGTLRMTGPAHVVLIASCGGEDVSLSTAPPVPPTECRGYCTWSATAPPVGKPPSDAWPNGQDDIDLRRGRSPADDAMLELFLNQQAAKNHAKDAQRYYDEWLTHSAEVQRLEKALGGDDPHTIDDPHTTKAAIQRELRRQLAYSDDAYSAYRATLDKALRRSKTVAESQQKLEALRGKQR